MKFVEVYAVCHIENTAADTKCTMAISHDNMLIHDKKGVVVMYSLRLVAEVSRNREPNSFDAMINLKTLN